MRRFSSKSAHNILRGFIIVSMRFSKASQTAAGKAAP